MGTGATALGLLLWEAVLIIAHDKPLDRDDIGLVVIALNFLCFSIGWAAGDSPWPSLVDLFTRFLGGFASAVRPPPKE